MARNQREIRLPAPYLKRLWLDPAKIPDRAAYPFCLPFLQDDFELRFSHAITIIVGENGTGKSTLLEGGAALAGGGGAGGGGGGGPGGRAAAGGGGGGARAAARRAGGRPGSTQGGF